ncbi:MAG TPA: DUF924 family protein [Candidatus Cybelea sp.]|nr:DUF924 family protein [Candidatus Cybelea sp.]
MSTGSAQIQPSDVLDFWFSARARALWFEKNAEFDAEVRHLFGSAVGQALSGGFQDWRRHPEGTLALLILLDQMTRNVYRGSPLAFAGDTRALEVAERAIAAGFDRAFPFLERRFFYLPHEHCENSAVQQRCLELFTALLAEVPAEVRAEAEEQLHFAKRHAEIIAQFGRFPHRNAVLGRACTPDEESFLATWDNAF